MVFSDQIFLFLFLPIALALGLASVRTQSFHAGILCLSLTFFYWASGYQTLLLIASIAGNYVGARLLEAKRSVFLLALIIVFNLAVLMAFKYAGFAADVIASAAGTRPPEFLTSIALPIGISFYTFQGISYVVDVWRGEIPAEHNLLTFGAYISFFPQLIAGPIVRYRDVTAEFHRPAVSFDMFSAGAARFVLGLGKKVLIADKVAPIADAAFGQTGDLGFSAAVLGAVAYTIQIYFDFSGYSDMAIGLGQMFGVRFLENFNHPYAATTLTEFWKRWHISLSSFFRDYVYIPLGGNRKGRTRTLGNLLTVFALTGFWHGAAWNFLLWGLWHGSFLLFERMASIAHRAEASSNLLRFLYFFPAVIFGWVLFRAPDIQTFGLYAKALLNPFSGGALLLPQHVAKALTPQAIVVLVAAAAIIVSQGRVAPMGPWIGDPNAADSRPFVRLLFTTVVFALCVTEVIPQSFSPFLYFRF